MDKRKKKPGRVLFGILITLVLILLGLFVFHRVKHGADMKYLTEKGYYNPVSVGDHSLNVVKFGLSGSHFIYKTEPIKCEEIIEEFLDRIK